MNSIGINSLLKTKVNNVWSDFIPENKPLPAVSFTHIANSAERLLEGSRTNEWDSWRVMVVAKNRADRETLLKELLTLDNTENTDFKKIFTISYGNISASSGDKTRVAYVDIKAYNRGL